MKFIKFLYRKCYLLISFIKYFLDILITNKFSRTEYSSWRSFKFEVLNKDYRLCSNIYDLRTFFIYKNSQKYKIEYLLNQQLKNIYEIFYDIGANVGEFAIPSCDYFNQVISFEPNPIIYSCLSHNAKNKKNCLCSTDAISNYKGKTLLKARPLLSGGDSLKEINNFNQDHEKFYFPPDYLIETNVIKISDSLIDSKNVEKSFIMKIDTEGCEYNILIDFYENIVTTGLLKKQVLIMFENNTKTDFQLDFIELIKKYLESNFSCYAIFKNKDNTVNEQKIIFENLNYLVAKNCEIILKYENK